MLFAMWLWLCEKKYYAITSSFPLFQFTIFANVLRKKYKITLMQKWNCELVNVCVHSTVRASESLCEKKTKLIEFFSPKKEQIKSATLENKFADEKKNWSP